MSKNDDNNSEKSLEEKIEEYQRDLEAYNEREESRWDAFHSCDSSDLQGGMHQYQDSSEGDSRPDPRDYGIEDSD